MWALSCYRTKWLSHQSRLSILEHCFIEKRGLDRCPLAKNREDSRSPQWAPVTITSVLCSAHGGRSDVSTREADVVVEAGTVMMDLQSHPAMPPIQVRKRAGRVCP